jgi:hypothetical protein
MSTKTHAAGAATPRAVHAGVNAVTRNYSVSDTLSNGDVLNLCKVPAGALVLDVICRYTNVTGNQITFTIGDDGSSARYIGAQSATGTYRATVGIPYSQSIDQTIRLTVASVTSTTAGGTVSVTVLYQMDELDAGKIANI